MDTGNNINWQRLISALTFYKSHGYKYIDLDWSVNSEISEITKPVDKKDFFINGKALVASGEQSFLQMIKDGDLPNGKYCGITPCFRDEHVLDELHQQYFMKVELIDTLQVNNNSLMKILEICKEFFEKYIPVEIIKIDKNSYDIIDCKNKIELGSYGLRRYENMEWLYITGLAEPRLSRVLKLQ